MQPPPPAGLPIICGHMTFSYRLVHLFLVADSPPQGFNKPRQSNLIGSSNVLVLLVYVPLLHFVNFRNAPAGDITL